MLIRSSERRDPSSASLELQRVPSPGRGRRLLGLEENVWKKLAEVRDHPAFGVEVLSHPDGRVAVLLGETHAMRRDAYEVGKRLLEVIPNRAVEGPKESQGILGWPARRLMDNWSVVVEAVSAQDGMAGTLCAAAEQLPGGARSLEAGHRPRAREQAAKLGVGLISAPVAGLIHLPDRLERWEGRARAQRTKRLLARTADKQRQWRDEMLGAIAAEVRRDFDPAREQSGKILSALGDRRNQTMAQNLATYTEEGPVIGVMGRAHLREHNQTGVADLLEKQFGFRRAVWLS